MFQAIQNAQRAESLRAIAENGLSESAEHWLRAVVHNPTIAGRGWYRDSAFAFRQLSATRWQWRVCSLAGGTIGQQGTVAADTPAQVYAALAQAVEHAAQVVAGCAQV